MSNLILTKDTIVDYLGDIFIRKGADSYLGEAVTMSEHMLQTALNAETDNQPDTLIAAALLHDIGHYSGEFSDDYLELGIDNQHQLSGASILQHFFPDSVVQPVRWHVEAKRYLCATEPDYFAKLSVASVQTLALQGGPFNTQEVKQFSESPFLSSIIQIRKYDDAGKIAGVKTPDINYYLDVVQKVLDTHILHE